MRTSLVAFLALVAAASTASAGPTPQERLAIELLRCAEIMLEPEPLEVEVIEAALVLMQEAVRLAPEDEEAWRLVLQMSHMAEREDLAAEAIRALVRINPADDRVRLLRLTQAIDRYQTVADRISAYERVLATPVDQLGASVASRLALDLALLQQRNGDLEAYGRWLGEATAIDPGNPAAAAMAAGFFMRSVDDPFGEAELLVNAYLANPNDAPTLLTLGSLLMEQGAYAAAARIFELAIDTTKAERLLIGGTLLADMAMVKWAAGDIESALRIINDRQRGVDGLERQRVMRESPEFNPIERRAVTGHLGPTLATIRAVIHSRDSEEDAGEGRASLERALAVHRAAIEDFDAAEETIPGARYAEQYLQMAWLSVWLGGDLEEVATLLESAESHMPLSDAARARFDGWIALRRDEPAVAIELLADLPEDDAAARIGRAIAYRDLGNKQAAAHELLETARRQPGTVIGIWASNTLAGLVGRRMPLSDLAGRLEQLVATMPRALDRYPRDATLAVSFRVSPRELRYDPYDPVLIDFEVVNRSVLPLAFERDGPLRPNIIVDPVLQVTREASIGDQPAIVVDIAQRLALAPGERMIVTVNLSRTRSGHVLMTHPLAGSILRLKSVLNFNVLAGSIGPGLFGSEADSPLIRIDGVRVGEEWLEETVRTLESPDAPDRIVRLALLANALTSDRYRALREGRPGLIIELQSLRDATFAQLDPVSQAWILAVLPPNRRHDEILAVARRTDDRLVMMAYILFHLAGVDDPMLDAARRLEDPNLTLIADLMQARSIDLVRPDSQGR